MKVSACLITRGDVDLEPILSTLPYDEVLIWGPDRDEHPGTYGRYQLMREATYDLVYTQDDDCIFRDHDRLMLDHLNLGEPLTAVYGHGDNPDGLQDVALVHGGAIINRDACLASFDRYLDYWPRDEGFYREADMISGTITQSIQLGFPYEIRMDIATRPNRMANQPWQRDLKHKITNQARTVRDA